jgi:hypothetical protein
MTPWQPVVEAMLCALEREVTSPFAITGMVACEVSSCRAEREAGTEEGWERVRAWMVRKWAPADWIVRMRSIVLLEIRFSQSGSG